MFIVHLWDVCRDAARVVLADYAMKALTGKPTDEEFRLAMFAAWQVEEMQSLLKEWKPAPGNVRKTIEADAEALLESKPGHRFAAWVERRSGAVPVTKRSGFYGCAEPSKPRVNPKVCLHAPNETCPNCYTEYRDVPAHPEVKVGQVWRLTSEGGKAGVYTVRRRHDGDDGWRMESECGEHAGMWDKYPAHWTLISDVVAPPPAPPPLEAGDRVRVVNYDAYWNGTTGTICYVGHDFVNLTDARKPNMEEWTCELTFNFGKIELVTPGPAALCHCKRAGYSDYPYAYHGPSNCSDAAANVH